MPIYAFVESKVLACMAVWSANKDADFSGVTDNPMLFEFIERIGSVDRAWISGFETAQDIIQTLRIQLAYRMHDGLTLAKRFRDSKELDVLDGLGAKAFRLAVEEPAAWEYKLFAQVLIDEVAKNQDLRFQHRWGIAVGTKQTVAREDFADWVSSVMDELKTLVKALGVLIDSATAEAFAPPGVPADKPLILSTARQIAILHGQAIQWSQRIRRVRTHEFLDPVMEVLATLADDVIGKIESTGPGILAQAEDALRSPRDGRTRVIEYEVHLELPDIDRVQEELRRAEQRFAEE
jgi:hypothetical protein